MVVSLRSKVIVLTIIAIISLSTITFQVLQNQQGVILSGSNLTWAVNEGDEFSFSVNVEGSESSWMGEQTYYEYNWSSENIIIQILELPEIPSTIDKNTFIVDILGPVKVQCLSTDIPGNYSSLLVSLLSKFLLPVGSWDVLDKMFDDNLPLEGNPWTENLEFDTDYFAGNLTESNFYMAQIRFTEYFPNWSTVRWKGWSSLDIGLPEYATYINSAPMCTSSSSFSMSVTLNI